MSTAFSRRIRFSGRQGPAGPPGIIQPAPANTVVGNPTGAEAIPVNIAMADLPLSAAAVLALAGKSNVGHPHSASDITSGTLAAARLPATAVQTTSSYSDPTWITALAASKITGTFMKSQQHAQTAYKDEANTWTPNQLFLGNVDIVGQATIMGTLIGSGGIAVTNNGFFVIGNSDTFYLQQANGTNRLTIDTAGATFNGQVNAATEYRLAGNSFSRVAQIDGAGGWGGGYNFNINSSTSQRDSTGSVAAIRFDQSSVQLFAESSGSPGAISPRYSFSPTMATFNGTLQLKDGSESWRIITQYSDSVGQLDFINTSSQAKLSMRQNGQAFFTNTVKMSTGDANANSYGNRVDSLVFSRGDLPTSYLNKITNSFSATPGSTTMNFELGNGSGSGYVTPLTLRGDGAATFNGTITAQSGRPVKSYFGFTTYYGDAGGYVIGSRFRGPSDTDLGFIGVHGTGDNLYTYFIGEYGNEIVSFNNTNKAATFNGQVSATSGLAVTGKLQIANNGSSFGSTLTNGNSQFYNSATSGLIIAGAGSTSDLLITNKAGSDVFSIPTGSTGVYFPGTESHIGYGGTSHYFGGVTYFRPVAGGADKAYVDGATGGALFTGTVTAEAFRHRNTAGEFPWMLYSPGTDVNWYIRDMVNSRMQMMFTPGASSSAANTQIHSQLTVEGNATFNGTITSAFQTLSGDPTTLDIPSGMHRVVKNTTSEEVRNWVNDGGVMKKSAAYT